MHSSAPSDQSTINASKRGEARRQAHNALHWLVRFAASYAAPEPNAAHTLLRWDSERQAFATKPFGTDLAVELRPAHLEMQFTERGQSVPHTLYMEERSPAQVEAWALVELLHRGLSRTTFSKDLPYRVPDLMTGDQEEYSPESFAEELQDLTSWMAVSGKAFAALKLDLGVARSGKRGDLICWPDRFQVGLLVPSKGRSGDMLRVGLCAGDAKRDEPFFFVAPDAAAAIGAYGKNVLLTGQIPGGPQNIDEIAKFLRAAIAGTAN